jgi:hypothetical protein
MTFKVLTAVKMLMVFWVVTPCGLKGGGNIFLRNVSTHKSTWHYNPED